MSHLLFSIDITHNRKRFYRVAVEPTLLGEVCLTRSWGRIGGTEKRLAPRVFEDWESAIKAAGKIVARKARRGYVER